MLTTLILASQLTVFCNYQAVYAETVMQARQLPVPIVKMLEAANDPLNQAIVVMAYRKPRFESPVEQKKSITDFSNTIYLMCLENTDEHD